jgi:hypothetical protein
VHHKSHRLSIQKVGYQTCLFLVQFPGSRSTITTYSTVYSKSISIELESNWRQLLLTLFVDLSTVLHPRHVVVLTANFIRPPTVGVAICIVLVCSPETARSPQDKVQAAERLFHSRKDDAFSPRIGSKILISGFDSWLSK